MSYHHYAQAAQNHVFELFRSITLGEIDHLSELLESLGEQKWRDWRVQNFQEILSYLRATPSERKKKRRWQNPDISVLLKYNAYREASRAYSLLYAIGVHYLPASGPYRDMTAAAADAYYEVLLQRFPDWPFDRTPPKWMPDPRVSYGDTPLDY